MSALLGNKNNNKRCIREIFVFNSIVAYTESTPIIY